MYCMALSAFKDQDLENDLALIDALRGSVSYRPRLSREERETLARAFLRRKGLL